MPPLVNTPELRFQVDESRKFAVIEEVLARLEADGADVDRTDGARVSTPDGWWLLRASNTGADLVARAEVGAAPDHAVAARRGHVQADALDRAALDVYLRYNSTPRGIRVTHRRSVYVFRRAVIHRFPAVPEAKRKYSPY